MKRAWGFDHIMTKKGMLSASSDVGFIFIAYNLKRIINIIGIKELIEFLSSYFVKNPLKRSIKRLINNLLQLKSVKFEMINTHILSNKFNIFELNPKIQIGF